MVLALNRILAAAGAGVDRAALRVMARLWLSGGDPVADEGVQSRERAREIYTDVEPLSFFPQPRAPRDVAIDHVRRIHGGRLERWRFESDYETYDREYQGHYDRWAENRTTYAECLVHDRPGAPAIVCLHSWATGNYHVLRYAFFVRDLYRAGFDVALMMMPFHGPRNPKGSLFGGQLFPGTCPRRTNEGFRQTIWDARRLIGKMFERGAPSAGVMGMSMGGYSTALLAGIESRLSFAIPIIPMVSFADLIWSHGENHPTRRVAEARGVTLDQVRALYRVHSPLAFEPKLPAERLMIVAGEGDRVCSPEHVRMLWDHWGRPEIHWFPGGHLAHFGRLGLVRAVGDFLRKLGLSE